MSWKYPLLLFILISSLGKASVYSQNETQYRSKSAVRERIMSLIQAETASKMNRQVDVKVKSWTNTTKYTLVVGEAAEQGQGKLVFSLLEYRAKKWEMIEHTIGSAKTIPFKNWKKKYKDLPEDLFLLAEIAIQTSAE